MMHLSSVIPANGTRESMCGCRNFPCRERGLNLGPLAPEASALTTELPRLTARYTILCTRRLQPPRDDCAVPVQWFSSMFTAEKK